MVRDWGGNLSDFGFKRLKVYQKSLDLSIKLCRIANRFPAKFQRISDQLIGAAISICLNIAEGSGRISDKDKISFYKNSRGSSFEIISILEICLGLNLINKSELENSSESLVEISKMLSGLIKSKSP